MKKKTFTIDEIVKFLMDEHDNETIEGTLIKRKLIRELYKQLGDPAKEDFEKETYPAGTWWGRFPGYTTDIQFIRDAGYIKQYNNAPNDWHIKKASDIKQRIVRNYNDNGWHATIQSHNVLCGKYVKHPRYKHLAVYFYSTRDCNKYEYVIIRED